MFILRLGLIIVLGTFSVWLIDQAVSLIQIWDDWSLIKGVAVLVGLYWLWYHFLLGRVGRKLWPMRHIDRD
ncbi:MAG: hypothetical protein C3F02_01570 [Parcubacteria group bacterium]|nr:MAG: hypothetical protein C3F02_01570 [Parcubacteria group bacterium]